MTTSVIEFEGRDYELDYNVQPATGPLHYHIRNPDQYYPAYAYDVKAFRRSKFQLVEIHNIKTLNHLTALLNKELEIAYWSKG